MYNRSQRNSVSSNNENQLRTDGSSTGKSIKIIINTPNSVSAEVDKRLTVIILSLADIPIMIFLITIFPWRQWSLRLAMLVNKMPKIIILESVKVCTKFYIDKRQNVCMFSTLLQLINVSVVVKLLILVP